MIKIFLIVGVSFGIMLICISAVFPQPLISDRKNDINEVESSQESARESLNYIIDKYNQTNETLKRVEKKLNKLDRELGKLNVNCSNIENLFTSVKSEMQSLENIFRENFGGKDPNKKICSEPMTEDKRTLCDELNLEFSTISNRYNSILNFYLEVCQ